MVWTAVDYYDSYICPLSAYQSLDAYQIVSSVTTPELALDWHCASTGLNLCIFCSLIDVQYKNKAVAFPPSTSFHFALDIVVP